MWEWRNSSIQVDDADTQIQGQIQKLLQQNRWDGKLLSYDPEISQTPKLSQVICGCRLNHSNILTSGLVLLFYCIIYILTIIWQQLWCFFLFCEFLIHKELKVWKYFCHEVSGRIFLFLCFLMISAVGEDQETQLSGWCEFKLFSSWKAAATRCFASKWVKLSD